jgi:hypothetical protein
MWIDATARLAPQVHHSPEGSFICELWCLPHAANSRCRWRRMRGSEFLVRAGLLEDYNFVLTAPDIGIFMFQLRRQWKVVTSGKNGRNIQSAV